MIYILSPPNPTHSTPPTPIDIKGSNFQTTWVQTSVSIPHIFLATQCYCIRNIEGEQPPTPFRGVVDLKDLPHITPKSLPLVYHSVTEITQPVPKGRLVLSRMATESLPSIADEALLNQVKFYTKYWPCLVVHALLGAWFFFCRMKSGI